MVGRTHYTKILTLTLTLTLAVGARAQSESTSVFDFLKLPTSAHGMALGGTNTVIWDDDASLLFQNPALMANTSDRSISLGFLTYMQGCKAGTVAWTKAHRQRGTWGLGAQFVGYGTMKERSVEGVEMGDFGALDMAISGGYSYMLTDRLVGGAMGKFIYSKYGSYSSVALAVDLGLNYLMEEQGLSLSLVAANLGGQLKAFGDVYERLPFDLRLGFSKQLQGAPLRFSLSMVDLTRWSAADYYNADGKLKGGQILLNHFVLGVDIIPMEQFYVALGFNFRRAYEMKAAGGSHAAGLCLGAGVHIKKFKLDVAYAKYHLSAPSLLFTAQYAI